MSSYKHDGLYPLLYLQLGIGFMKCILIMNGFTRWLEPILIIDRKRPEIDFQRYAFRTA